MTMLKDKKGISAKVLVGVIILVVSIVAVFLIYGEINWEGDIERQICHQSIVSRAAPFGEKVVSLNCKTQYVCITEKTFGGKCESFDNLPKTKKVTEVKAKTKNEINGVIADKMYKAFTMLGSGDINFEPTNWGGKRYCFLDSRIAFDENIKNNEEFKNGIEGLDDYLATQGPEGEDKSYTYLFSKGKIDKLNIYRADDPALKEQLEKLKEKGEAPQNLEFKAFSLNPEYDYDLVYIIDKKGHESKILFWVGAGTTFVGGVAIATGILALPGAILTGIGTVIIGAKIIVGGVAVSTISIISKGKDANHELTLIQHDSNLVSLQKLECDAWETLS